MGRHGRIKLLMESNKTTTGGIGAHFMREHSESAASRAKAESWETRKTGKTYLGDGGSNHPRAPFASDRQAANRIGNPRKLLLIGMPSAGNLH